MPTNATKDTDRAAIPDEEPSPVSRRTVFWSTAPPDWSMRGYVVAVMLLAVLCLSWTIWIMLLTSSPTATVNYVMGTGHLDFGSFWRLSDSPQAVVGVALAGLATVVLGYVVVLKQLVAIVLMAPKRRIVTSRSSSGSSVSRKRSIRKVKVAAAETRPGQDLARHWYSGLPQSTRRLALNILDRESGTRRTMHVLIKILDLAIQCVYLAQLLVEGIPVGLIVLFSATLALNALCTAAMCSMSSENVGRVQLAIDTAFDAVIALVFPALVLVYALTAFTFDVQLMAINAAVYPPGVFEQIATAVADPIEVDGVRRALDSLRIDSVTKIFTRVGMSIALCRRLVGLAEVPRPRGTGSWRLPNIYPTRQRWLAALFLVVSAAVVVGTTGSILTSSAACAIHPECVQVAHRWVLDGRCPCLAMIDRNITIANYDEWESPIDRTAKLAQLASSGDLQMLQLVNRALPTFPEELRQCKHLKHVSLFFTNTVVARNGSPSSSILSSCKSPFQATSDLPNNIFNDMHELVHIQLGMQGLKRLPSFDGLTNLKTLTLGGLFFLTELPSFDRLTKLERLMVASTPRVQEFPDLRNVRGLEALVVIDRGAYCCNGFLGPTKCDLNRSQCQTHLSGAPAITECLSGDRRASPETRAYFDKFSSSACVGEVLTTNDVKFSPTPDEVKLCNGTLYRACQAPGLPAGTPAMCYNARWMPVACDPTPFPMEMRRRQIALGHGTPCDLTVEAWLGCKKVR